MHVLMCTTWELQKDRVLRPCWQKQPVQWQRWSFCPPTPPYPTFLFPSTHQRCNTCSLLPSAPAQPPLASRPEANGAGVQIGVKFSRLALLGPGGLLTAAVTKTVTIGRRLGDGVPDDAQAPDVLLFDPADHPDLRPAPEGQAYTRLLVDKFIAGKLRPHQVEGVSALLTLSAGGRA